MEEPLREFLTVKRKRIWVTRFVVVQDGLLYYFLKPTDLKPRGILNLPRCTVQETSQGSQHTIIISHGTDSSLRLRFDDQRKFNAWLTAVKAPSTTRKSTDSMAVKNCECAITFSVAKQRNSHQAVQLSLHKADQKLLDSVARLAEKTYILEKHNGALVYKATTPAGEVPWNNWSFYSSLAAASVTVGLLIDPVLSSAVIVGGLYWQSLQKNKLRVPPVQFKAVVSVRAGLSEVLSTLMNPTRRTLWHPNLANFYETKDSLTLEFVVGEERVSQLVKQVGYGDTSTAWLVETVDAVVKNLFVLEDRSTGLELITLMTHYGEQDAQTEDPLVGSWDILNNLKVFIEASHMDSAPASVEDSDAEGEESKEPLREPVILVDPTVKKYNDIVDPVYQDAKRLLADSSGWEDIKVSSPHIKATRKKASTGLFTVKGEGMIPRSADEITELVKDLNRKPQFDEMFESGHLIERVGEGIDITYQRFKKMFPVSGRDFCIVTKRFVESDGTVLLVSCSTSHANCPPVKGLVRGTLHMGVVAMKQSAEGTLTTYMTHADPGGSLPSSLVSSVQKKQPMVVEAIKNILK
jgi:hypothetical protein